MKIGIVGQGYVGTAIKVGFESYYDLETYDKFDESKTTCDLKGLVEICDVIFVCVPTPMKKDGSCDTSIVEAIVKDINDMVVSRNVSGRIVAIKSTIPPGTTNKLNKECKNIPVIFNPEFLTEANFIEDFKNQNRIIIGGPRPATTKVKRVFAKAFPKVPIIKTGSTTAEMVKYLTNCFLAMKVSFANEMNSVCGKLGIDYDKVIEYEGVMLLV